MKRHRFKLIKALDYSFTHIILIIVAFIFLFPCLWLILASLSSSGSIHSFKGFFPDGYSFDTFKKLFTDTAMYNYPRWFFNSLKVSIFSALFGTILLILTAYVMSRFRFKSRKSLMKITLLLGMFPSFMGMTAVYLIATQFGLVNNHWGLILIYSASAPMGYLVQKGFFDTVPSEIYEAAVIDGANELTIFRKITLPISKPMLVYTILTQFVWPWSDFILPKLLLKNKDLYTVAVGLMTLGVDEFARYAAGAVFVAVPIVTLYFILSKYLIAGISQGAVK